MKAFRRRSVATRSHRSIGFEHGWTYREAIRRRLVEIFDEIQQSIADCLRAAVKARQLRPATNYDELASFLYSSLQGAILQAKAERSAIPLERFKKFLFSTVLR